MPKAFNRNKAKNKKPLYMWQYARIQKRYNEKKLNGHEELSYKKELSSRERTNAKQIRRSRKNYFNALQDIRALVQEKTKRDKIAASKITITKKKAATKKRRLESARAETEPQLSLKPRVRKRSNAMCDLALEMNENKRRNIRQST